MTYEQIDRLLNAGFTPDQIMSLSSAPAESAGPPPADQAGDDQPDPREEPAENSSPASEPAPDPGILEEIKNGFDDLKKTIQANNIKTMSVDNLPGSADSAETVLAGIIRPPFDDKK